MSTPYTIYVDVVNRLAVTSPANNAQVQLPPMVLGETPTLQIFFLQPKNDGSGTYNVLNYSSGYSFEVALCGNPNTPVGQPLGNTIPIACAVANSFTNITSPYQGIQGAFPLTDPSVATLIGAVPFVNNVILEIQVTDSTPLPVKVLDAPITVKASVIRGTLSSTPVTGTAAIFNNTTNKWEWYINGTLVGSFGL